ncbi:MAG: DNA topoisomerase 3 [Bacteroidia bacterium]|nr:DNA topoisomerase 3 [Bacteroidia bacterium]
MDKVVIAEKPSVARDLARVMGANSRQDGYIEGNGYAFTWAFGHLVELKTPEQFQEWKLGDLPILPAAFELQVNQIRDPKTKEYSVDEGVAMQIKVIENLFDACQEIIVATDAGREGELIFRYIYEYLGCEKPFRRLWISSVTDEAIRQGFVSLRDGAAYDNLYHAARCRSEADWLVGINATRALSLAVGSGLFSLGRVQTPTLAMICARYLEHQNFKPETFFDLQIHLEKSETPFKALSLESAKTRSEAESRLAQVQAAGPAEVVKVESKEKKEPTPLLYDLTALQQDANKRLNLSADNTLKLAQSLYEKKYISYPRTGSRYIGEDVFAEIPDLLTKLAACSKFSQAVRDLQGKELSKRSVNAAKVTDHHALLPTGEMPSGLTEAETAIYELVLARMLEAFGETCIKEITTIELVAAEKFQAKGTLIRVMGWRSVLNVPSEDKEEKDSLASLPALAEGEKLDIHLAEVLEKQTRPKPLLNDSSLLQAMKTCGREVDDEEMQEALKDSGLGTPATRASIIETLFKRQYIERQKKSIIPTAKGLAIYEALKAEKIANAELTGAWEKKLLDMERGQCHPDDFISEIHSYTREITGRLISLGKSLRGQDGIAPAQGLPCPKCGQGTVRESEKNFYCSAYKEGCDFRIWREVAGKKLSEAHVKQLLDKGKTGLIKGFTSKAGKKFDAMLTIQDKEKYSLSFEFPPHKTTPTAKRK